MSRLLEGKVAIITGGTSGIGEATVERFVEKGAKVLIVGRNREKGAEMERHHGANVKFLQADVAREAEIIRMIDTAKNHFGRIDCLFNNAGSPTPSTLFDLTEADYRSAMDVLVGSVIFGMKHVAPILIEQGAGTIVNNASVAAGHANLGDYLYSIAKAAVLHASRMAGVELGRHGITVNSVSPGVIATPIFYGGSAAAASLDPAHADAKLAKLKRNLAKASPMLRAGTPSDIADAVVYLASPAGSFVNCHDLVVDGGLTAGGRVNYE